MKKLWLSSKKMTIFADVDADHMIIDTAPIARKFIKQPVINLVRWMEKQGGLRIERLR